MSMNSDKAYEGEITLAFDYRATETSATRRYPIEAERISYVMIEEIYENERILPVLYISVNLDSDMYTKITNSRDTSEFYLRIRKRNALSKTSVFEEVVNDTFSYVTPNTNANYADALNQTPQAKDASYRGTIIGLVSSTMTNELRRSFNGVYKDITVNTLVKELALGGMRNLVVSPLKYDKTFKSLLLPPMSSRFKLLSFIFSKFAFYDSYFTFFMDFKNTYLITRNAEPVPAGDGKPDTVILEIKNYTAPEAYTDGFSIQNGAYVAYINANDTNVIVNTSTDKVANNIVSYSDETGKQNLSVVTNPNDKNETKTTYIRSRNAAAIKNDLQSNAVMVQLLKQNLDPDIFTPNKKYNIKHYPDYEVYNGKYYLAYKREFFYHKHNNKFIITCSVGLKQAVNEEVARSLSDSYSPSLIKNNRSSKRTSSNTKSTSLGSSRANRRV